MRPEHLDDATRAYHEAGHVLMAHLLGARVVTVTLESDDERYGGQTAVDWQPVAAAERNRASAWVALAGPVAEARWRGDLELLEALSAWHDDWQQVEAALMVEAQGGDWRPLLKSWLREVSVRLAEPVAWEHLCRVADQLEAHRELDEDLLHDVLG